jgi:hypothetical protein
MENEEIVPAEVAEEIQVETPAEEALSETDETKVEESPVETPSPAEPKKKTAQERIDEITRLRRQEEREKEYWKKVALSKEEESAPSPAQSAFPNDGLTARPEMYQFETVTEYEDALFAWYETKKEIVNQNVKQQEERQQVTHNFNQRANAFRAEYEDFDEVIEAPVFSPIMRDVLFRSESGPQIAYYLGRPENWDTAEKIRKMPPLMQVFELGKLETQFLLAQKTKKVPGAPSPIKPVGITGGVGEKDTSKMSDEEWWEYEKQKKSQKISNSMK